MEFHEIKRRMIQLDTASICDACKTVRTMDTAIRPIQLGLQLIGKAITVRCHNDFLAVMQALHEGGEGDVLIVDGQGGDKALAGELFATEAMRKGLAGMVIDGACRDTRSLRRMKIPIYARATSPMAGTAYDIGERQVAVNCGGIVVSPGDIIFGDDDGLVVCTVTELTALIPVAEEIQRKERLLQERMSEGAALFGMSNLADHYLKRSDKLESKLQFVP